MTVRYQNGDITIDNNFARFGAKSFAINKINSVEVRSETVPGSKAYRALWTLAAVFVILTISNIVQGEAATGSFVAAAVLGLLGFFMWEKRHDVTTHRLFLVTSSAEAQAFVTHDWNDITELRTAIEDAMVQTI